MWSFKKILSVSLVCLIPVAAQAGPLTTAQPIDVGLTKILNFLLSIIGIVGILSLVIAGAMYFFAAGDMRQILLAKKAMIGGITGMMLALGGYVLIKTIASLLS